MGIPSLLEQRRQYSEERLAQLRSSVASLSSVSAPVGLCLYVTGSFGRLEASDHSDVDLFFVQTCDRKDKIGQIQQTLLDAELILLNRSMGFPEFSNDGEYLRVHQLDDVLKNLGEPEDDYSNRFTARLLLLLESRPLFGDLVYENTLRHIVNAYCRDYEDHKYNFRPVFMANDIMRFWKTLCLNYESSRNQPPTTDAIKAKAQLKNLKLKFSRMMTCFSGLIALTAQTTHTPDTLTQLVLRAPIERLTASVTNARAQECLDVLLGQYAWFLENVAQLGPSATAWLSDEVNRQQALARAAAFGEAIYQMLLAVDEDRAFLRYLVV